MMKDLLREQLIRIVQEYGVDILKDTGKVKGLLKDFCPEEPRGKIFAITQCLREGIHRELIDSSKRKTIRIELSRLIRKIHDNFGLKEDISRWAVETIALALGIIIQDKPVDIVEKKEDKALEKNPLDLSELQVTRKEETTDEKKESVSTSVYSTSTSTRKTGKKRRTGLWLFGIFVFVALILVFILISRNKSPIIPSSPNPSNTTSVIVPEMELVEKGSFTMGDTWGDGESDEKPTHKVTLTYDFYIGKYETTFDEYDSFCNATGRSEPYDEGWGRGRRPVINVSWWDAISYCNWLSEKEGIPKAYDDKGNILDKYGKTTTDITEVVGYRLPTEAEWEYAARGGNKSKGYKYSGSDNADDVAWYASNSKSMTQEVGTKLPNELGIYDMSGNVWEWCSDWYDSGYYAKSTTTNPYKSTAGLVRLFRGGSWGNSAAYTRVANRDNSLPTGAGNYLGFRIARTVP